MAGHALRNPFQHGNQEDAAFRAISAIIALVKRLWAKRVRVFVVCAVAIATVLVIWWYRRWNPPLHRVIDTADRLIVRTGGTCHRRPADEKTLLDMDDPVTVAMVASKLEVDPRNIGFSCACCGGPTLEFYKGQKLVASLGIHHARSLRWADGPWAGDGVLTPDSARFLVGWLDTHNVHGPQEELDATKAQELQFQRNALRATAGFPKELADALDDPKEFSSTLRRLYRSPQQQVDVLLSVFGGSNDSWTSLTYIEQTPDALLREYPLEILQERVRGALLGADRQRRRGAARLWMSWQSPIADWRPADIAELHRVVLNVQLGARYRPLRQSGLAHLVAWGTEFGPQEVDQWLRRGLQDPDVQVRRRAVLTVGQLGRVTLVPELMRQLSGASMPTNPLPDVPAAEQEDVPETVDIVAGQASDQEVAALALAWMNHHLAIDAITQMSASPMREVSLALLGEQERLRDEHFASVDGNLDLQLAAVEAVIRCRGKAGLDQAMKYQTARFWWEDERVTKQLRQMLLENAAPGKEILQSARRLADLRAWYERYGQQYIQGPR